MNRPQAPRTRVALVVSLVLLILAIGMTLSRSPAIVARSNRVQPAVQFETITAGRFSACQGNEVLPRHTIAIRISLDSVLGPRVGVRALKGKRLLTRGERGAGWTSADVTIPVRPVPVTTYGVSLCFEFFARDESVGLTGQRSTASQASRPGGFVKVEYLAPGNRSWWSLASSVARHMAFGHAWSGIWIVAVLASIMGTIVAVVSWLALRLAR
jgi:hypothetical protein